MCPISRLKCALWIFLTTVRLSPVSSLPHETSIQKEINSQNCSDQIYPSVNITSGLISTELELSITHLMMKHNPMMTLTCYEFYPVEWVFDERPSGDAVSSLRERREWISSENGEALQRFLIDVTLNLWRNINNITCRAVDEGEVCRQTTVKFFRADTNGFNTTVRVYKGLPRGELLQQYSLTYAGNNINCSLLIIYNYGHRRFECYGQNNDHTVFMKITSEFRTDLCYDTFSCGLLHYNTKVTQNCRNRFPSGTRYLLKTLNHSLYGSDDHIHTGIVTCTSSGVPKNNDQGTGILQKVSTSSHFFAAKVMYCRGSNDLTLRRRFHLDLEPLSLIDEQNSDFITLCGLERFLIAWNIYNVTCHTSVYLFAEGVDMKIIMKDGSEINLTGISLLNEDNPLKIKQDGYHTYQTQILVHSFEIREISCSAPLRKSTRWTFKAYGVQVVFPEPINLEGNTSETVLVKPDSDVILGCSVKSSPLPTYEWTDLDTGSSLPKDWIGFSRFGEVLKIPSRNISMLVNRGVLCKARNYREFIIKRFSFELENSNGSVVETSDYAGRNWSDTATLVTVIVLIIVGGIFAFLVWKILQQRRNLRLLSQVEIEEFMNGNPELLINSSGDYDINSYSTYLPYNQNFEVQKEQLTFDMSNVIGSGAYGIVLKGILSISYTEKVQVAIKTTKPMDDISYLKAMMSELKIMGFIGKHDNIVNLLGAYTKNLQKKEIFIAIEYCDNGCLLDYLRSHREIFDDHLVNGKLQSNTTEAYSPPVVFTTTTLLRWCMQISNGMNFLSQKKVIHGDIAARNVLLSVNLIAKIGDFGLSRQLFEYANYIKKQQSPLPWKWLAIECLQDMKFSPQSDVWAYGITLWEIFTLGQSPFPGFSYDEYFIDCLVGGKRPVQPQYATKEWYNLMTQCWLINPSERPSFADISLYFDNTIRSITQEEYMDIDSTSKLNTMMSVEDAKMLDFNIHEEDIENLSMNITHD